MANKLLFNHKYIEIQCDRNDVESQMKAGEIPYVHRNRINTKYWTTIRNIDLVLKLFRGIDETEALTPGKLPEAIFSLYEKEMIRRIKTKSLIEQGPQRPHGWLRVHQQLGREIAEVNNRFAYFYDTRTGKTPMSLQIVVDDIERNPNHKWLVLCPLILIENAWLEDANHFFPNLKVQSLHAKTKTERLGLFSVDANLYIANIESFTAYREHIEKLPIHGCFVDESSTMKSHSSKFSKAAVEYSRNLNRWYLLSGSPAPNGEWEYYMQLKSIDEYGVHESWTQFKNYFFVNISRNPQYDKLQVRPDRKEELLQLLRKYSLYVDKEDVLQTPGRDFIPYEFKMPEDLSKQYHHLREKLYLELGEDVIVSTPSVATKLNKLNQVSSGFVIDTEAIKYNKMLRAKEIDEVQKEEAYLLSMYRFELLDKLLKNIGDEQVLIWANYHKEFEIIKQMYGDRCGLVYGKVNITEKNKALKDFKEGRIQYLVGNPASMDKGLTLTNAHFSIYFSMNYSYELWKQSSERIYGDISKQKHRCTYYILIAKGTVDRVIYNAVSDKKDISMAVLNHLKGGTV